MDFNQTRAEYTESVQNTANEGIDRARVYWSMHISSYAHTVVQELAVCSSRTSRYHTVRVPVIHNLKSEVMYAYIITPIFKRSAASE